MIVKMKKLTLLCLAEERQTTVDRIAELGAVQVVNGKLADTLDRREVADTLARTSRVIAAVSAAEGEKSGAPGNAPADELAAELDAKLTQLSTLEKEAEQLTRQRNTLLPWGDFSTRRAAQLAEQGVHIVFCQSPTREFAKFAAPENCAVEVVGRDKSQVRFVLLSLAPFAAPPCAVQLPECGGISALDRQLAELAAEKSEITRAVARAKADLPRLETYRRSLRQEHAFLACRDGMAEYGEIAVVKGYIPVTAVDELEAAAARNGWGVMLEDPAPDEEPPVLLDMPKWLTPIKPLLAFLGILPGYRESDVSLSMLVFMVIFFSLLINDAGYGLIFLVGSVAALFLCRGKPAAMQAAVLFMLFSAGTFVWGILAGCWFGVDRGGWSFLTGADKNNNIEFICFTLAVIQLTIGHLVQLAREPRFRNVVSQIAWIMVLVGFYIVAVRIVAYPGNMPQVAWYLIGGGAALLVIFKVNWKDVGSIFNFPFEIINCFTDTLSYIRLFAVGMSSGYMASCFNGMGADIIGAAWWAIPFGVLLILAAHALNIALGLIAVLVHGVRLNTLEFSSHSGLTWSGTEYNPLTKK